MLTPEEQRERKSLMASGHTARTSSRLDTLNRRLNGSKSDAQVLSEIRSRAVAEKPIGQLVGEARRRGLRH